MQVLNIICQPQVASPFSWNRFPRGRSVSRSTSPREIGRKVSLGTIPAGNRFPRGKSVGAWFPAGDRFPRGKSVGAWFPAGDRFPHGRLVKQQVTRRTTGTTHASNRCPKRPIAGANIEGATPLGTAYAQGSMPGSERPPPANPPRIVRKTNAMGERISE